MCGILCNYSKILNRYGDNETQFFYDMLETLGRRGPDQTTVERIGNLLFGHTRLSIIDLDNGSQPIYNEDRTVAVILNGEIYNYLELASELKSKGHYFQTKSDTEVIVHLYEDYGEDVFCKLNGMFAIIIYDTKNDMLLAGRDRLGEKPLVYMNGKNSLCISSEVKALSKHIEFINEIDIEALYLFFNSLYVPAPYTIYKNIRKLMPAHYLKYDKGMLSIKKYWNPEIEIDWDADEKIISEEFINLLSIVVKEKLISDVPIGAFLSGGIDSSSVVAYMANDSKMPIKTFTVGFSNHSDERPYARLIANKYQTEHTELFIEHDVLDTFKQVMTYFDEPFGDASALPTFLVSKAARNHVKVILSGDGGDELFAGYEGYIWQKYINNGRLRSGLLRRVNQYLIKKIGVDFFNELYQKGHNVRSFLNWRKARTYFFKDEIDKMLNTPIYDFSPDQFFNRNYWLKNNSLDPLSTAYGLDINYYLPDDLLKKVDMASMMCGLETRSPYLDHRMVEFALKVPPHLKLKYDKTKYLVKKALNGVLPEQILNREKMGFGSPVHVWMRNELKEFVIDLLQPGCMCEVIINRKNIRTAMEAVFNQNEALPFGTASKLWMMLVLEWWLRHYSFSLPANC